MRTQVAALLLIFSLTGLAACSRQDSNSRSIFPERPNHKIQLQPSRYTTVVTTVRIYCCQWLNSKIFVRTLKLNINVQR